MLFKLMTNNNFKGLTINLNARHVNGMIHFDSRSLDFLNEEV